MEVEPDYRISLAAERTYLAYMVLLAFLVAGTGRLRWLDIARAMRSGLPLPRSRTTMSLSVGITVAAVLGFVVVLTL